MYRVMLTTITGFLSKIAQAFSYTLEISETELQAIVMAMQPMQIKKFFIAVCLSKPEVDLSGADDKLVIATRIEVVLPAGIKTTGSVWIKGSVSYRKESGEFFLQNPQVVDMAVKKLPRILIPALKYITQLAAKKNLAKQAIYRLGDDNIKHKLARAVLRSVAVENEKLIVVLGWS